MGGGGNSGSGTTVQKNEPWDQVKPHYERLYSQAEQAFNKTNRDPYSGPLVANPTASQTSAVQGIQQLAPSLGAPANAASQNLLQTANGNFLDPNTNPGLQGTIRAIARPVLQNFQESVVPGINSQAISQGAYGGARQGLALGRAASGVTDSLADSIAKTVYENYAQERQNQMAVPSLLAQTQTAQVMPYQLQAAAGQQEQQWNQDQINAQIERYNQGQMAPWAGIANWAEALGSDGGSQATVTKTLSNSGSDWLSGLLGIGGLGLSAYTAFSDRRLKRNILKLGEIASGIGMYLYNYLWSDKLEVGLMADEVEKWKPEVIGNLAGFKTINYSLLEG